MCWCDIHVLCLTDDHQDVKPDASGSSHILPPAMQFRPTEGSLASLEAIDKRVADAVRHIQSVC